jgi:hypothetical protein
MVDEVADVGDGADGVGGLEGELAGTRDVGAAISTSAWSDVYAAGDPVGVAIGRRTAT